MAKRKGRPEEGYETVQIRIDTKSANLLKTLAGLSGKSLGAFGDEELVPVLREMLGRKLKAATQELAKDEK